MSTEVEKVWKDVIRPNAEGMAEVWSELWTVETQPRKLDERRVSHALPSAGLRGDEPIPECYLREVCGYSPDE